MLNFSKKIEDNFQKSIKSLCFSKKREKYISVFIKTLKNSVFYQNTATFVKFMLNILSCSKILPHNLRDDET